MIVINKFGKKIHGVSILEDINLELSGGKVYGLQGKNGSGKTMLLRALSGLIKATSGYVEIDGKRLGRDMTFPESIGVLIENPAFVPHYSGYKNLKILADIRQKIGRNEISNIMENVGLNPEEKKSIPKIFIRNEAKARYCMCIHGIS